MSKHQFEAVIFDLDGVITSTAAVHAAAIVEIINHFSPFEHCAHHGHAQIPERRVVDRTETGHYLAVFNEDADDSQKHDPTATDDVPNPKETSSLKYPTYEAQVGELAE